MYGRIKCTAYIMSIGIESPDSGAAFVCACPQAGEQWRLSLRGPEPRACRAGLPKSDPNGDWSVAYVSADEVKRRDVPRASEPTVPVVWAVERVRADGGPLLPAEAIVAAPGQILLPGAGAVSSGLRRPPAAGAARQQPRSVGGLRYYSN